MRRARGILAVALIALLALEVPAVAASWTAPTSLGIVRRPTGPITKGTKVVFRGRLKSERPACRRNKVVQLIRVGKGPVARTRTDRRGRYRFVKKIGKTTRWRTRFRGSVAGVHPNIRVCKASRSRILRVRVRR